MRNFQWKILTFDISNLNDKNQKKNDEIFLINHYVEELKVGKMTAVSFFLTVGARWEAFVSRETERKRKRKKNPFFIMIVRFAHCRVVCHLFPFFSLRQRIDCVLYSVDGNKKLIIFVLAVAVFFFFSLLFSLFHCIISTKKRQT